MSAGTGIVHSEYNLEGETTQIFQIWIVPDRQGHAPRWETKEFPKGENAGQLVMLASGREGDGGADVPAIHQNAALFGATLAADQSVTHELPPGRQAYLVPARGTITVNGIEVGERDGVVVNGDETIRIEAREDAEIVLADLP